MLYSNGETSRMIEQFAAIAAEARRRMSELAQAWALAEVPVPSPLVAPDLMEEVEPIAAAVAKPLTVAEREAIDALIAEYPVSRARIPSGSRVWWRSWTVGRGSGRCTGRTLSLKTAVPTAPMTWY